MFYIESPNKGRRTSDDGKANIGCGVSDDGKARIGSVVSVDAEQAFVSLHLMQLEIHHLILQVPFEVCPDLIYSKR